MGMKIKLLATSLLVNCAYAADITQLPFRPDSGNAAILCGQLIDGVSNKVKEQQVIIVREGRIVNVTTNTGQEQGLPVWDLSAYTCLPGLIDTHTHLADTGVDSADVLAIDTAAKQLPVSRKNALLTLQAGFTTVRDLGSYMAFAVNDIRDRINQGTELGPRIQTAGYYLTTPNGGGDTIIPGRSPDTIPALFRAGVARGSVQFAEKAQQAIDGGADLIKVIASGAVLAYGGVPGAPEMTQEEIAAVVTVAHAAGLKVAAHAHGAASIIDAILAGVDTIEHASFASDEAMQLALEHHVGFSMDIYDGDYIAKVGVEQGWPEEFIRKGNETTEAQREVFRKAVKLGIAMLYGTDAAVYPHGDNGKQFSVAVKYGQSAMAAIQSATSVPALYMGWDKQVGSLVEGRFADIVAVKGDPLRQIELLEKIDVVIKGGHIIKWQN